MTTSSKTLWSTISKFLEGERWQSLQEIYSLVESQLDFDSDDTRPEVGNSKQFAWQRNVRNVLKHKVERGDIQQGRKAHYRLTSSVSLCVCCGQKGGTVASPRPPRPRGNGKPGHCDFCGRNTQVYDQPQGGHDNVCHSCWAVYARLKSHPTLKQANANRAEVARTILSANFSAAHEEAVDSLCSHCRTVLVAVESHPSPRIHKEAQSRLLNAFRGLGSIFLGGEEGDDEPDDYRPDGEDRRIVVQRQIRARRGRKQFRDALRQRYRERCVVTGCQILDILEAAHINPYRGDNDNHPANGLLLRADIHTLFDLNLLGIEPSELRIELHPAVAREYESLGGKRLKVADGVRPAASALAARYQQFCSTRKSTA